MSQSLAERRESIWEITLAFLAIVLFQLPLVLWGLYFVMKLGLKPILTVSNQVKKQDIHTLHVIDLRNMPSEIVPVVSSFNLLVYKLDDSIKRQNQFCRMLRTSCVRH